MSELDKTPLRDEDFVDLRFQDALLFIKCLRLKGVRRIKTRNFKSGKISFSTTNN